MDNPKTSHATAGRNTTCKPLNRSQQKHQDILVAAEQVFIEKGFKHASMDEIASVAQVSKRTVYNHFTTKEALFNDILLQCCDELFFANDLSYKSDEPLETQLKHYLAAEWEIFASDRIIKLTRIVIGQYVDTPGFANQLIEEIQDRETTIKRWLLAAEDDNRLKLTDVDFAERFLIDNIKSHCHYPAVYDQPALSPEAKSFIIDETIALFLSRYAVR